MESPTVIICTLFNLKASVSGWVISECIGKYVNTSEYAVGADIMQFVGIHHSKVGGLGVVLRLTKVPIYSMESGGYTMKDLEQDIYALWKYLWNKGMIGSTKHTDKSGRERVRYFINDYGVRIFSLTKERYKLGETENVDEFFTDDTSTKVLIVCPFCGGKTEQGLLKCQKCGAAL